MAGDDQKIRDGLSLVFAIGGFAVVLGLGITVMATGSHDATDVLNTVVPLVATWVGSVIAYYFSSKNLDAATNSVATFAKGMVDPRKLQSIGVQSVMIPRSDIVTLAADMTNPWTNLDAVQLGAMVKFARGSQTKVTRIPIFKPDDCVTYLAYVSELERFITMQAMAGNATAAQATFHDFAADAASARALKAFVTVGPNATLDQVKAAMDRTAGCDDAFITQDGTPQAKVLGWITDDILWTAARV